MFAPCGSNKHVRLFVFFLNGAHPTALPCSRPTMRRFCLFFQERTRCYLITHKNITVLLEFFLAKMLTRQDTHTGGGVDMTGTSASGGGGRLWGAKGREQSAREQKMFARASVLPPCPCHMIAGAKRKSWPPRRRQRGVARARSRGALRAKRCAKLKTRVSPPPQQKERERERRQVALPLQTVHSHRQKPREDESPKSPLRWATRKKFEK